MTSCSDNEVVLTFDDGPWPTTRPPCSRRSPTSASSATFFPIGKHATYYPEILKQVAEQGHTVGSHTWSHANLDRQERPQEAKDEIEKGIQRRRSGRSAHRPRRSSASRRCSIRPTVVTYLGERNIAIFSTDFDSFDFKIAQGRSGRRQRDDRSSNKYGKGIVLMHDFQQRHRATRCRRSAQAAQGRRLQGRPHEAGQERRRSSPNTRKMLIKEAKLPTVSTRPTSERGAHDFAVTFRSRALAASAQRDNIKPARPTRRFFVFRSVVMAIIIEGCAIVSADGMLADADHVMPQALKFDADQRFFNAKLDECDLMVHGRNSYEDQKNSHKRRRLILTHAVATLAPSPDNPKATLWNPDGASFADACDFIRFRDGRVAIIRRHESCSACSSTPMTRSGCRRRRMSACPAACRCFPASRIPSPQDVMTALTASILATCRRSMLRIASR